MHYHWIPELYRRMKLPVFDGINFYDDLLHLLLSQFLTPVQPMKYVKQAGHPGLVTAATTLKEFPIHAHLASPIHFPCLLTCEWLSQS